MLTHPLHSDPCLGAMFPAPGLTLEGWGVGLPSPTAGTASLGGPGRECGHADGVGVGLEWEPTANGPDWGVDLVRVAPVVLLNLSGLLWPLP